MSGGEPNHVLLIDSLTGALLCTRCAAERVELVGTCQVNGPMPHYRAPERSDQLGPRERCSECGLFFSRDEDVGRALLALLRTRRAAEVNGGTA